MSRFETRVRGSGPLDAETLFIGETPGEEEVTQRAPFVGPSGYHLFDRACRRAGFSRSAARIENVIEYLPPDGEAKAHWALRKFQEGEDALQERLKKLQPKRIILVGGVALWRFLGIHFDRDERGRPAPPSITSYRGSLWRQSDFDEALSEGVEVANGIVLPRIRFEGDPTIIPILHPAFIMRGAWYLWPFLLWDLKRGLFREPRRPLPPLPANAEWTGLERLSGDSEVVLDLETMWEDARIITLIGLMIDGRTYQSEATSEALALTSRILREPRRRLIGQNIVNFDLPVLDDNGVEHSGEYWDTMSLAKLHQPDLPVGLGSIASRTWPDFIQWKSMTQLPALESVIRAAFGDHETPTDRLYNKIDLFATRNGFDAMWAALTPRQRDLFAKAHVALVPHRRVMMQRGMQPDLERFATRRVEIAGEIQELETKIQAAVSEGWEARTAGVKAALLALPTCPNHKGFSKKCDFCTAVVPHREERADWKGKLKRLEAGFNVTSPKDWVWYFFEWKRYDKKRARNGIEVQRKGLERTAGGALSVNDDALLQLQRKLLTEDIDDPLIAHRVRMGKLQKKITTYIDPFLPQAGVPGSGALLDVDGKARPQYNDAQSRMGRWSSGKISEEGGGK